MVIRSRDGERVVPAEDYFVGPGTDITRMTVLRTGELLTSIRLPGTWAGAHFYFEKVADRNVWDFPLVNVAAATVMSGDTIERMRIAVNGVAATPLRLPAVENAVRGQKRDEATAIAAGDLAIVGALPLHHNAYKVPLLRNLVEACGPGTEKHMDILTWGRTPWGEWMLTHISWDLLWASLFAGLTFLVAHASYMLLSAHRKRDAAETDRLEAARTDLPVRIARHSLAARLFHWVMAAAMFVAAVHGIPPDRRRAVRLGPVALDGGARADHVDRLSHHSRDGVDGLLVHLGRTEGHPRTEGGADARAGS